MENMESVENQHVDFSLAGKLKRSVKYLYLRQPRIFPMQHIF